MIDRELTSEVQKCLQHQSAVVLVGPRQCGKTTLAKCIASQGPGVYLDLESEEDLARLQVPRQFFEEHRERLIVLDEVQRKPEIFRILRGVIDHNRQKNRPNGQFLLLGSASIELLKQSSESLAGRISVLELGPFAATEVENDPSQHTALWARGGFPQSFMAPNDEISGEWRGSFLRTYLERDVPFFSPRVPAETLRRLWVMLAHEQGSCLNASKLASSLGISSPTVARYVDLMVDLLLVRRLPPYFVNNAKRLVKAPKIYVRDSGLTHRLLGIRSFSDLLSHPVAGPSWEGHVIENLIRCLPQGAEAFFYRTQAGAEVDLVLEMPSGQKLAVEIKRSLSPKPERGFYEACADLQVAQRWLVYPGTGNFPAANNVRVTGLVELMQTLRNMR